MTRNNDNNEQAGSQAGFGLQADDRMTIPDESLYEEVRNARRSLLGPKSTIMISTWNVRTMCDCSKTNQILKEMYSFKLDILGLCESRLVGSGRERLEDGSILLYSGHEKHSIRGVGMIISKKYAKCILEWKPINDRLLKVRFNSKYSKLTVIQCYAPTNQAEEEEKDNFYEALQREVDLVPRHDVLMVNGDLNAKVGEDNTGKEGIMGKHGLGVINDNGQRFVDLCSTNDLVIGGTIFPHKKIHKQTWISPDSNTKNQIDHITINRKWRSSLQDVRVYRGADVNSDHYLLTAKLKLKLKNPDRTDKKQIRKYDVSKLKDTEVLNQFRIALQNRFSALEEENLDNENTPDEGNVVESKWKQFKTAYQETAEEIIGYKKNKTKPWLSKETWDKIEDRKKIKSKILTANSHETEQVLRQEYKVRDKLVKRSARKDKRDYVEDLANQAEVAARKGNSRELYKITKLLSGKNSSRSSTLKNKQGEILTTEIEKANRWVEHFKEVLNRPLPNNIANPEPAQNDLNIRVDVPSQSEVRKAIETMKPNKAPGIDQIQAEILKADLETSTKYLTEMFVAIWDKEVIPDDWCKGVITKLPKKGDLSICDNWRGITLLPQPSKVFCKVLLSRIDEEIDEILREEQAGFRKFRGCADQIFALRNIIEQATEYQKPLFINFVDFKKAFDSICRDAIWNILRSYGIPEKIVRLIKLFYTKFECCIDLNTELSDWFEVNTGVRQGCIISPILFLITIDWVMRQANRNTQGLKWIGNDDLHDLDFADDLALLAESILQLQVKTDNLALFAEKTGLQINVDKTKTMYIASDNIDQITIDDTPVEKVQKFTYLGSLIHQTEGASADIKTRIDKANASFAMLKTIWKSNKYSERTKLRIYNSNVKSVLLYGAECWKNNVADMKKLDVFHNKSLRRICKIYWPEVISNKNLYKRTNSQPVSTDIKHKRLSWLGHVLRMNGSRIPKQTLSWMPGGSRRRGRPKGTWKRTMEKELEDANLAWEDVEETAQYRREWKNLVKALCSPEE